MRARKGITLAVIGGLTAVAVALPAQSAAAADFEGTPPSSFLGCDEFPDGGGWVGFRDTTVLGTGARDEADVRPRNVRFGEPCVEAGAIAIPARLSDMPVPMLDEDEDGEDDGAPPTSALCNEYTYAEAGALSNPPSNAGASIQVKAAYHAAELCDTVIAIETYAGTPVGNVGPGATFNLPTTVSVVGNTATLNFTNTVPTLANGDTVQTSWSMICRHPTTGVMSNQSFTGGNGSNWTSANTPFGPKTATCSTSGHTPYAVVTNAQPEATSGYPGSVGVLWSSRSLTPPTGVDGTGYYGGTQAAQFVVPGNSDWMTGGSFITCSTSYGIAPTITLNVGSAFGDPIGFSDAPPIDGSWTFDGTIALGVAATACPFLHSMTIVICGFTSNDPDQYGCTAMLWSSAQFNDGRAYDGSTPEQSMCVLYPSLPGCYDVLHPPTVDGTDFGEVCAGAPEPVWLDFSWLPATIGHYANCLFVPVNGWDRLGWIDTAVSKSGLTQTSTVIGEIAGSAIVSGGQCGVLLDASANIDGFVIDTCAWAFPPEAKQVLHYLVLILGGFFLLAQGWNVGPGAVLGAKLPFGDRGDDE